MIYAIFEEEPNFPATDQHKDAKRYKIKVRGKVLFVDATKRAPTIEEIEKLLEPSV